jgi:hypothetical protein
LWLERQDVLNFFNKASAQSDNQEAKKKHTRKLMFILNKKSLDYIEDQRHKTKNRNVIFNFIFEFTYLKTVVHIGSFTVNQHNTIGYSDNPTPALNPRILISGNNDQMLEYPVKRLRNCFMNAAYFLMIVYGAI